MNIELTEEQKIKILNSDDVFNVMQRILLREEKIDQEKEHFWMIGLATNNRILYIELVCMGSVNATTVEPMNVFRVAVLKGAIKTIMVHNHPSGELQMSEADKNLTDRLIQVGKILNIIVIDHLVISTRSYLSFKNTGWLEKLEKSTKWVPKYKLIDQIRSEEKRYRKEAVKIAEKKALYKGIKQGIKKGELQGIEKRNIELARYGLQKGLSIELISELTGMTIEEIEKIRLK